MEKYFKKANGIVFKVMPNHDLKSLKDRFTMCDVNGNELKKAKPKAKKKAGN